MTWLIDAFWARIGWILGEIAFVLVAIALALAVIALCSLPRLFRQNRCQHLRFQETMACDAICLDCGKNLGFIGPQRERIARGTK